MKKNLAKLYIVLMLVVVSAPLTAMAFHAQTEPIGNETEVAFPGIRTADGSLNLNYFPELGDWFESHFAFRAELVSLNSWLQETVFGNSSEDTVITGSDGWLYYAATLDDYQHNNNVSERTLFNEAHNVALYQEIVESDGATFLFTIAPNKNTLYGEYMPAGYRYQVAEESDFERLVPYLEAEGVHYVDLRSLFDETDAVLYYARDSHWTEPGAVLVYNALLDAADVDHETYEDVTPTAVTDYYGDLAVMLYPDTRLTTPETRLVYLAEPSWQYTSDTASVEENYITTQNKSGKGSLLMYRDSFGNSLLPYMAEAFRDATFSKNEPLDGADLASCDPDVVIYEKVERHLPSLGSVPAMVTGPVRYESLADVTAEITEDAESGTTCSQSQTSGYTTISGVAAGDAVGENTRFYVAVTDASGTMVYEAYTVNTSGTEEESDYGYLLYLDEASVTGEITNVRVFAVDAEDDAESLTLLYVLDAEAAEAENAEIEEEREAAENAAEEALEDGETEETTPEDEADSDEDESAEASDDAVETAASENTTDTNAAATSAAQSTTTGSSASGNSNASQSSSTSGNSASQSSSASGSNNASQSSSASGSSSASQSSSAAATTPVETTPVETTPVETAPVETAPVETASVETAPVETTPAAPAAPAAPHEVSRVFIQDCGYDSGYWDITYSDGSHQYIDVP